jgi:hypothetical protein
VSARHRCKGKEYCSLEGIWGYECQTAEGNSLLGAGSTAVALPHVGVGIPEERA